MTIRLARLEDDHALREIDRETWSPLVAPTDAPPSTPFFRPRAEVGNVFVAEQDARIVGYASMGSPTSLPRNDHVWDVTGVAVSPSAEGRGIGRALMQRLIDEARARGARRITLRVFATNERAQRLYKGLGFEVEGVLRGEFRLGDDEYVDDVQMALTL